MEYSMILLVLIVTYFIVRTGALGAATRAVEIGTNKLELVADKIELQDNYNHAKALVKLSNKAEALMEQNDGKIPTKKDVMKILQGRANKEA